MPYLVGYPTPQDYGAVGNGVADDTAALNSALAAINAAGGGALFLPPDSKYLVSGTISVPPFTFLKSEVEVSLNLGTLPASLPRIIASASWAPSSATGIVSFLSQTPGGWSVTAQSSGLKNIAIDGNGNTSANLNGIFFQGPVYDTHLEDVYIVSAPHNGVHAAAQTESGISATFPYHQRWTRVTTNLAANTGFNLINFTDSTFSTCLAFASGANNYALQNNSNAVFTACRAEWSSGGRGWDITGSAGSVLFNGCTTDKNFSEGFRIHSATGQTSDGGGIIISGGKFHGDGLGGTNNNGIIITGSTVPVSISGVNVEAGVNSGTTYPANGLSISTSSNVVVSGSTLQGQAASWLDGGGNTNITRKSNVGATGNAGSQTFTVLPDLGSTIVVGATAPLGDNGVGEIQLADASTVPTTNPTAGTVHYSQSATTTPAKIRDVNGNVRSLADGFFVLTGASDPTFTSATQTATTVTLAVEASATYLVEAAIIMSNATGSTTPSWTGPTGATMQWCDTTSSADYSSTIGATNNSFPSNTNTRMAFLKGYLVTSTTAGSLTLTLGVSAGTTTLFRGSTLRLTRVK